MEFLNDYFVVLVVVICLCIGYIIKNVVPGDKINKFIPIIVGVLGVIVNTWINGWAVTPEIIACGLVSGLGSTGLHQLFKQVVEKKPTIEGTEEPELEEVEETTEE